MCDALGNHDREMEDASEGGVVPRAIERSDAVNKVLQYQTYSMLSVWQALGEASLDYTLEMKSLEIS